MTSQANGRKQQWKKKCGFNFYVYSWLQISLSLTADVSLLAVSQWNLELLIQVNQLNLSHSVILSSICSITNLNMLSWHMETKIRNGQKGIGVQLWFWKKIFDFLQHTSRINDKSEKKNWFIVSQSMNGKFSKQRLKCSNKSYIYVFILF